MLPNGTDKYLVERDDGCVGWRGRFFYGRPVWHFWMQRGVWEEAHGPLPPQARVSSTCGLVGCLNVEHLRVTEKLPRVPKTHCRNCGGILSRDVNTHTYCQQCNSLRAKEWRERH